MSTEIFNVSNPSSSNIFVSNDQEQAQQNGSKIQWNKLKPISSKEVIFLCWNELHTEWKKKPLDTTCKAIASLVGLSAIYPAVIGSWACIKTLFVIPISDMESHNREIAMAAAQGIGNAGMGITYITQIEEFVIHPITQLFINVFHKKICKTIKEKYQKSFDNLDKNNEEVMNLLIQKINLQLLGYNGLTISKCFFEAPIQKQVDDIQNQIDREIEEKLSLKNLVYLLPQQIKKDTQNSSWIETLKKTTKTVMTFSLIGACCCVLGIGTYGCYKPFDLQDPNELASSDQNKVKDAIANYANTGHGLEYLAVSGILTYRGIKSTVGKQYNTVMSDNIRNIYDSHIDDQPNKEIKDILICHREQTIDSYRN